jgi:hypothetical protein
MKPVRKITSRGNWSGAKQWKNRVEPFHQTYCAKRSISEQMRSDMRKVVTLKSAMFWDVMPCSFVNMYQSWYKLDASTLRKKSNSYAS